MAKGSGGTRSSSSSAPKGLSSTTGGNLKPTKYTVNGGPAYKDENGLYTNSNGQFVFKSDLEKATSPIDSVKGYQSIYKDLSRYGMSQADKLGYGLEAGQDGFVFSHARSNGAMARAEVVEFDKGQYQIMGAYDSRGHSIETLDRAFTFQGAKKYVAQLFKSWGHK